MKRSRNSPSFINLALCFLDWEGDLQNRCSDHPGANIKTLVKVLRVMISLLLSELQLFFLYLVVCWMK